jgi:hypothetical protein
MQLNLKHIYFLFSTIGINALYRTNIFSICSNNTSRSIKAAITEATRTVNCEVHTNWSKFSKLLLILNHKELK